ncbi:MULTISPECIES: chemotaxis protein CheB [Nostocales]|uniref:protein-glutamate methylesterase n=3 Tax=Nostocales TaxID=1161 RepID=A0A0C1R9G3_9CYAN|nr:chemotaxis protein CheB [Tolypothrix bouteillei]KAF3885378.1 response regulator [Tolypothrix bouteillei VB521301]
MYSLKKKVVLIEDSPIALEILQRMLNSSSEIDVVGTARNGEEGLAVIIKTQPDVICTDLLMENMDGLELTRRVMAENPRPILVISNYVQKTDIDNVFRLLQAGAVDVFPKPASNSPTDYEKLKSALIAKIKVLSNMKLIPKREYKQLPTVGQLTTSESVFQTNSPRAIATSRIQIISLGGSTGSLQTIQKILNQLPSDFPLPVICVLHVGEGVLSGLVKWLSSECGLRVKVAEVGEFPLPRTIYFAPEKNHLELDSQGAFIYAKPLLGEKHCPAITVTFKSVANYYGRATAGVLLSGIGNDGAAGLQAISQAGGITLAQNENAMFGMVKEAVSLNAVQHLLNIEEIAPFLLDML